jgi:hypothetical protein
MKIEGGCMRKKNLIITLYSPPEYYPPTLNAIEFLAQEFNTVTVVFRNYTSFNWIYPKNVTLITTGSSISVREAEGSSLISKVYFFAEYIYTLFKTFKRTKARCIMMCDYIPVLSVYLLLPLIKRPELLWYHNHDVGEAKYLRKWTISWFAWKSESWIFPQITLFSLPAIERKKYFPMLSFKGTFFFLPNFPSVKVYSRMTESFFSKPTHVIKLLYQGSIGELHGLEEIIPILNIKIGERSLNLILKGFVENNYLASLRELGRKHGTLEKIIYLPPTGYQQVVENAFTCHVGIGIHMKDDIMNNTLGTASNKIYEYAASGMPVLIYDNQHFRNALKGREWVFFTDTSRSSLLKCLSEIVNSYDRLSACARNDFENELCYEKYINPVLDHLKSRLC